MPRVNPSNAMNAIALVGTEVARLAEHTLARRGALDRFLKRPARIDPSQVGTILTRGEEIRIGLDAIRRVAMRN